MLKCLNERVSPVIDEGVAAPTFTLPALVDGVHRQVALEEYIGEDVVILAFYPGDFNPACDEESDLDELDLFTMQKDVTVLGIGPDTLYAHEAFADAYDLHIPLLSDTKREVAELYDVAFEDDAGQDLVERAVFVIDHDGDVTYAWSTRDMEALPSTEAIKDAIGETGGDETAFARYRVGHAHYVEGRRAFTSAMKSFSNSEWMIAQSDFQRAREEFTEADEHFDSAVRFVDDEDFAKHYVAAEEKATHLWPAADWLALSASHYSSGRGADGQQLRDDAERPLEEAREIAEPIDPDEWPPEEPPATETDDETETFVPNADEDRPAAALEVDIDEESTAAGAAEQATASDAGDDVADAEGDGEGDIDDEELAEIEAELAGAPSDDPVDEPPEERRSVIDHSPGEGAEDVDPASDRAETDSSGTHAGGANADGNGGDGQSAEGNDADGNGADGESGSTDGDVNEEITDDDLAAIGAEIAASNPTPDNDDDPDDDAGGVDPDGNENGDDDDGVDEGADVSQTGTASNEESHGEGAADGNGDDSSSGTDARQAPNENGAA